MYMCVCVGEGVDGGCIPLPTRPQRVYVCSFFFVFFVCLLVCWVLLLFRSCVCFIIKDSLVFHLHAHDPTMFVDPSVRRTFCLLLGRSVTLCFSLY